MGNPQHYSIRLPERCLKLINELWSSASDVYPKETHTLGPLTATFLLSMSYPIINIPIERIERQIGKPEGQSYADDRHLSPEAEAAFREVIQKGKLCDAPFFKKGAWRFVEITTPPLPNISIELPEATASALDNVSAAEKAGEMNAQQWISILRNALAHGGIVYLDELGRSSHGTPVKMYAFVSGKYAKPECQHGEGKCRYGMGELQRLRVLRISEHDYCKFLAHWVEWLAKCKITSEIPPQQNA